VVEIYPRLDPSRFEPMVGCFLKKGAMAQRLEHAEIPVFLLGYAKVKIYQGVRFGGIASVIRTVARLRRLIKNEQIDVVHSFLPNTNIISSITKLFTPSMKLITSKISLMEYKKKRPFLKLIDRLFSNVPDLVFYNAEAVRDDVLKYEHPSPNKFRLIYNGVDVETIHSRSLQPVKKSQFGIPDTAPVIGTVGSLVHFKGHADLLDAAKCVLEKHPDTYFVFVGRDRGARADLEAKALKLGIADNVRFTGGRSDIPELLGMFDVFAFPSHEEGCPNALIEAMAAARPIVATSAGGNSEVMIDKETGLLVPPGASEEMAEKILFLLEHPDTAQNLAQNAHTRATDNYTIQRMVNEMTAMYRE